MFLDDILYNTCEQSDILKTDIQLLNNTLCKICEDYYKEGLKKLSDENTTSKNIKVILDRTFNLWDLFVLKAQKSNLSKMQALANLFSKHTFKSQFLLNSEMKSLYETL